MPGLLEHYRPGHGFLAARRIVLGCALLFMLVLPLAPASPAVAAWSVFVAVFALSAWVMSRGPLDQIEVWRRHRERVFEDDMVDVSLEVEQHEGLGHLLVVVEDQFVASLGTFQRNLIPQLSPHWLARLRYRKQAERHRGLYLLGPVSVWTSDPLGIFFHHVEADTISRLIVYPRAVPLPGYVFPTPGAPMGPSMDMADRLGQGEEILSVRPYQSGDPMNRIHWRTSVRRGGLHTMEQDTSLQAEVALYLDLTKRGRYGTGVEATTEVAIGCATSILSEAAAIRHRVSLTFVRDIVEMFPAATGIAHLQHLLDRLAVAHDAGTLHFWDEVEQPASLLERGSRAVFISPVGITRTEQARALVERLIFKGVGVDVVLINEAELARIWRDQTPTRHDHGEHLAGLKRELEFAGARVFVLERGETAHELMPHAAEVDPAARGIR